MKNKKLFEEAAIELIRINTADIICTSGCIGKNNDTNDTQGVSPF